MDEEVLEQKPDYRLHRRRFSRMGWALTVLMLVPVPLALLPLLVMGLLRIPLAQNEQFRLILSAVSSYLAGYPLAWLLLRKLPAVKAEPSPLSAADWLRALLISLAVLYTSNFVTTLLTNALGALRGSPVTNPVQEFSSYPLPFLFLLVCVLAPLAEEIIFRALLLGRMRPYGDTFAVFASALLFSLLHGNLSQMLYAFALGVVFGWVALRTGRIRETVLLHAAVNFMGGFLPNVINQAMTGDAQVAALFALGLFVLVSIPVGGVLFFLSLRRLRPESADVPWSAARTWGLFFGNPGMVVFTLLMLASAAAYLFFL